MTIRSEKLCAFLENHGWSILDMDTKHCPSCKHDRYGIFCSQCGEKLTDLVNEATLALIEEGIMYALEES